MKTGFYTGRFQPFHLGHLSAIKQALNEVDFLVIGIGSAQYKNTKGNPFSAEERKKIIQAALAENDISENQYKIIPIPDIHDNDKWPDYVIGLTPEFQQVFVGNDGLVKELFEKHTNLPVTIVKKEIDICATDTREAMKKDSDWQKHLSPSTVDLLKEIEGVNRIKALQ